MKKTLRIVIVMLLAVIFAVPVGCKKDPAPAGEQNAALPDTDIVLAENGQTGYTVLLPAEATLAEQYAADLLVERFREATGATLPVEYDAGEPLDESRKTLSIGFTSVMRDSGITVTEAELNADGFKIVRRGNTVIMAARTTADIFTPYRNFCTGSSPTRYTQPMRCTSRRPTKRLSKITT